MTGARPVIGVTGPDRGGFVPWLCTAAALRRWGARPVRLSPARPAPGPDLHALVLGGGADIDPRRYGRSRHTAPSARPARRRRRRGVWGRLLALPARLAVRLLKAVFRVGALTVDPARDAMELELLAAAVEGRRPVLGICRGAQLINVFFGGTLHQDLRGYDLNPSQVNGILPRKPIEVAADSRLAGILGTTRTRVNSLNNQAVDDLGSGLRVVARDRDGIVQAVEHREHPLLIGVQWHPEYLPQLAAQRRLFRGLVRGVER